MTAKKTTKKATKKTATRRVEVDLSRELAEVLDKICKSQRLSPSAAVELLMGAGLKALEQYCNDNP